jgi:uncharacterized protein YdcH (DUF465 family)
MSEISKEFREALNDMCSEDLIAEVERLTDRINCLNGIIRETSNEIGKLRADHDAELAELRKDRDRIDWLEDPENWNFDDNIHYTQIVTPGEKSVRQQIDEARG